MGATPVPVWPLLSCIVVAKVGCAPLIIVLVSPGQSYYKGRHAQNYGERHTNDDERDAGSKQKERKHDPEYSKDTYQPFPGLRAFHNFSLLFANPPIIRIYSIP